jgi:hypothetical protein
MMEMKVKKGGRWKVQTRREIVKPTVAAMDAISTTPWPWVENGAIENSK